MNSIYLTNPPETYLNAHFLKHDGHAYIYTTANGKIHEYKVLPLCCLACKLNAIQEIKYFKELESTEYASSLPQIYSTAFTTNISPNKNINMSKYYLVFEREHLQSIESVKNINYQSLVNLLKLIDYLKKKYNLSFSDLSPNNLGVDSVGNLKIINLNLVEITKNINVYLPKYSVLDKFSPELFGENRDDYLKMKYLISQNRISF